MDPRHTTYALNRLRRKAEGTPLPIWKAFSIVRGALPGITSTWTDETILTLIRADSGLGIRTENGRPSHVMVLEWAGSTVS